MRASPATAGPVCLRVTAGLQVPLASPARLESEVVSLMVASLVREPAAAALGATVKTLRVPSTPAADPPGKPTTRESAASWSPTPLAVAPREDELAREGKRPSPTPAVAEFQGVSPEATNCPCSRECSSHSEPRWLGVDAHHWPGELNEPVGSSSVLRGRESE